MDEKSPLLQRSFQEAASWSRSALERCLDEVAAALQAAEGSTIKLAERDSYALALSSLQKSRAAWGPQYAKNLLCAFTDTGTDSVFPAQVTPSSHAALGGTISGFAGLTLVDDAQVTQDIEFARLSQQLRLQVDAVMADLDALISAAQGFQNVRPELNSLRPEIFARVLRDLLDSASVETGTRALWLKLLAAPMGRELRAIYEKLIQSLQGANLQAVSYRMVPNASGSGGGGGGASRRGALEETGEHAGGNGGSWGSGAGGPAADSGGREFPGQVEFANPAQPEVGEALFEDFLLRGVDSRALLADSYYARVDEELRALRAETDALPPSPGAPGADQDRGAAHAQPTGRRIDGQSPLDEQVWGTYARSTARKLLRAELKKEATHVGQVMGLEVVRKLVNQVAQDPRLMVPVRESIVALEPSLLRLAMVDPRFFSEETHPGRRLMERVAQRSFKYNDETSSDFQTFFETVRRAFNTLNGLKIESAQPFNSALATLETAWTERDRADDERSQDVLKGLRFAADRQAMADQIAFDMSSRPDLDKVPGAVLDFLFGSWSLVMAHARLVDQDNQIDPRGFGVLVSDLVWSVKQDFTLRQPAKLMDMIPGMVRKLNAGLDLIGQDPGERAVFFDILIRLHGPVLKLRRLKSEQDVLASSAMPLDSDLLPATAEQRIPKAAAQPWLAPRDQDGAGFEETLPSAPSALVAEAARTRPAGAPENQPGEAGVAPAEARGQDSDQVERVLLGLITGCWVDLFSNQKWRRAQLVWASDKGSLFMFVSHGGRPHSMTRRSCERLILHDLLRPVETHGVVAQALSALKSDALGKGHAGARGLAPA
jgi:hypothetical protein